MAGVNKVILLGNLGGDPEVRQTPTNKTVATVNIAVTERWKDQAGQKQERTEWMRVIFWGKQAEVVQQYLHKGSKVYVEGKLQTRSWEDKNGGGKRYATEVVASDFQFLDPAPNREGGQGGGFGGSRGNNARDEGSLPDYGDAAGPAPSDDDLPF